MDIEGLEIAALSGARRTLASEPRPQVVVEFHPSVWPLSGTSRLAAEGLLRDLRMAAVGLTGQADPLATHGVAYLKTVAEGP